MRQGVRGQRDHPRVYGEQQLDRCERGTNRGSSPRVRGAGHGTGDDKTESGIIPACAGSRLRGFRRISRRWDHPRVCGEQLRPKSNILTTAGSSPRVRGAVAYETGAVGIFGIIPACAGSSRRRHPERGNEWDHPRVCGEQLFLFACAFALWGSSPRVRGADLDDLVLVMGAGIIPARAGSSAQYICRACREGDHPRACGEQSPAMRTVETMAGSSPRVRGAELHHVVGGVGIRIIPARAGSRSDTRARWPCWRDHPRACGEQL